MNTQHTRPQWRGKVPDDAIDIVGKLHSTDRQLNNNKNNICRNKHKLIIIVTTFTAFFEAKYDNDVSGRLQGEIIKILDPLLLTNVQKKRTGFFPHLHNVFFP